jgi:hypothetical protein
MLPVMRSGVDIRSNAIVGWISHHRLTACHSSAQLHLITAGSRRTVADTANHSHNTNTAHTNGRRERHMTERTLSLLDLELLRILHGGQAVSPLLRALRLALLDLPQRGLELACV